MKRVVVTGMGIVSSIGNSAQEVLASLREAKSGIVKAETYAELGFRCQVHGAPKLDWEGMIDRKVRRFMGAGAAWNYLAMEQAIRDAGLEESDVSNERTGLIMGSGGPSTRAIVQAADTTREKGPKKVGPFEVPKAMSSTNSATLVHALPHQGRQLLDLLGLLHLGALHRQWRRADPDGQAGHRLRRRRRGARLDLVGPVRRHECDVVGFQRPPGDREPRL